MYAARYSRYLSLSNYSSVFCYAKSTFPRKGRRATRNRFAFSLRFGHARGLRALFREEGGAAGDGRRKRSPKIHLCSCLCTHSPSVSLAFDSSLPEGASSMLTPRRGKSAFGRQRSGDGSDLHKTLVFAWKIILLAICFLRN